VLVVRSVLAALAAALILAATASATPIYTLESCFSSDTTACAAGSQLGAAVSAVPSPDGRFVYGVSGTGGVTVYTRSAAHGTLTRVGGAAGCYNASGAGGCTPVSSLIAPFDLVFGPQSKAYALGNTGTVEMFAVNADGSLTHANCLSDTLGGCPDGSASPVIAGARSMVVTAGGTNAYLGSSGRNGGVDDGVTRFGISNTGILTFTSGHCITDSGAGACANGFGLAGGTDQMALTTDGKFLYTTGVADDSVAYFSRDTGTGVLTEVGCYSTTDTSECATTMGATPQAYAVLIPSEDQTKVYVGTSAGVVVFARDTTTGALTQRLQCLNATGANGCTAAPGLGVSVTNHLALSPDGTDLAVTEAGDHGGIVFLKRDPSTGLLSEFGGGAGCITADGDGGACRTLAALGGISLVHAAPNAAQFFLGACIATPCAAGNGTIAAFRADNPPVCANASVTTAFQTAVAAPLACSDPDGDPLALQIAHLPASGGLSAIDPSHSALTYNPFPGFSGTDSFTFRAIAHGLSSNVATDTIAVGAAPPPPTPRITSAIKTEWLSGSTTKVVRLTVDDIPKGATVKVICKGAKHAKHKGGCTFSSKTYREPNGKSALALKSKFKGAKLQPGTVITVDITAPGSIGKEVRFTIRKRHLPKSKTYCFPVGSTHAHTHC
jgi:Bacterial Ig domain